MTDTPKLGSIEAEDRSTKHLRAQDTRGEDRMPVWKNARRNKRPPGKAKVVSRRPPTSEEMHNPSLCGMSNDTRSGFLVIGK